MIYPNGLFNPHLFNQNLFVREDFSFESLSQTLNLSDNLTLINTKNINLNDNIVFTQTLFSPNTPKLPLIFSLIHSSSKENKSLMNIGKNINGKDNSIFSNQCTAEGLNTQAGYTIACNVIDGFTIRISNIINTPFYSGCSVCLYNLKGAPNNINNPSLIELIVNNVSNDGVNTFITFTTFATNHTSGFIAFLGSVQAHSEGENTIAQGNNSNAKGKASLADLPSKIAVADNCFIVVGDGQYSFNCCSAITKDSTPTNLTIDGKFITIRPNMSYMFFLILGGRNVDGSEHALFMRYGIISNENGTLSTTGTSVLGSDINVSGWSVVITADNIAGLLITATGESNKTIHWKARLDFVEIG